MKRAFALLMMILLLLCAVPAGADDGERVYDRAGLFSSAEETTLRQQIASFQQETGMDFVVVTSDESHGDASQQTISDEFYDRGGFGLDDEKSGVCYYIDMYDRQEYVSTAGQMIDYMTDERIERALDASNPNLRAGRYAAAVQAMLSKLTGFVKAGIPEGQYRYDVVTGQRLTARHKALTTGEILVSLIVGAAVALFIALGVHRRYKLKGSTYSYDYQDNSEVEITGRRDDYLRTTVTRTRKAPPPSSGGSGGFGGGGGSGVHMSSGGVSHGGGGRGF